MGRRFTWHGTSVVAMGAALLCLWCSLSVGAAVGVSAADSGDPCAKFNSCTACAAVRQHAAQPLQCGWCQTPQGGTCSNGTSTGPTNGTCDGASTWYWESDTCAALCTGLTTAGCDRCTANADCGWCLTSSQCLPGSATASGDGQCAGAHWMYASCAADPCGRYESRCTECAKQPGCGFCNDGSRCRTVQDGNATTVYGGEKCPTHLFATSQAQCHDVTCAKLDNCDDCTLRVDCGWCDSDGTHRCMAGNLTGPTAHGECGKGSWYFITCQSLCSANTNCFDCVTAYGCVWCDDRDVCAAFDAHHLTCGGASAGYSYNSNTCCEQMDCDDCIESNRCGWCKATDTCYVGGTSGTTGSTQCPLSEWYHKELTLTGVCTGEWECCSAPFVLVAIVLPALCVCAGVCFLQCWCRHGKGLDPVFTVLGRTDGETEYELYTDTSNDDDDDDNDMEAASTGLSLTSARRGGKGARRGTKLASTPED